MLDPFTPRHRVGQKPFADFHRLEPKYCIVDAHRAHLLVEALKSRWVPGKNRRFRPNFFLGQNVMHGKWSREGKILPADGGGAGNSLTIPQLFDRLMNPCSVPPDSSLPLPIIPYARQASVFFASLTLLAVLGWVDYLTGYELGFFVFYSAPIGLTAWYAGRWPAVAIALFASVTWWLADRSNGVVYSSRFSFYWNLSIHFLAFVINAVTIAKIRRDLDERHQLLAQLRQSRIGQRPNTASTCPKCGYQPASEDPVT